MDLVISPIVVNWFMEQLETRVLSRFHLPLQIWYEYINDTFAVIRS